MTELLVEVRKAVLRDIPHLLSLINSYAARGEMLPRTEFEMAENIRDFSVAYDGADLVGCGALHFYTPTMAEVRSLAVSPTLKGSGIGRSVVRSLEMEAKENGIDAIFAFTYVPQFFHRVGFSEVERGELPLKVWKDCLRCPKFAGCDEIAVIKRLNPSASIASNQRLEPELNVIQLPILANKQH
jgi:amino-acid N-acetyltransferase